MGKKLDLTGMRFGRLVVIEQATHHANGGIRWMCKCDCGKEVIVARHELRSGHTLSCGCLQDENRHRTIHGGRHTRLYVIWNNMKRRCFCPTQQKYEYYGGRGITVCDEWKNSFGAFQEWAHSHGYCEDLTIDRIDTNGNYCPENCRWATVEEQRNNMRSNVILEYNGQSHTMAEWARLLNISYTALLQRIHKLGWSVEKALTTPVRTVRKQRGDTYGDRTP